MLKKAIQTEEKNSIRRKFGSSITIMTKKIRNWELSRNILKTGFLHLNSLKWSALHVKIETFSNGFSSVDLIHMTTIILKKQQKGMVMGFI